MAPYLRTNSYIVDFQLVDLRTNPVYRQRVRNQITGLGPPT
jgi:hypothetical protein